MKIRHCAMIIATAAAVAVANAPAQAAGTGYTWKDVHDFCQKPDCIDGSFPYGAPVIDGSGNVYGAGNFGGRANDGVVFALVPNTKGYVFKPLYAFGINDSLSEPVGDLILDKDGNLYGTTAYDKKNSCGAVFKLSPSGRNWALSVVHQFTGGSDGCEPFVGLTYAGKTSGEPWDESSPLFGTADFGGTYDKGVVYEVVSDGSTWNETIIHNFQESAGPTGIVEDPAGNLWGTTETGGKYGGGLMYTLASGTWKETTLHNFCNSQNCADGKNPIGRLFLDGSGNVYGTTAGGGSNCISNHGCGVIFERLAGGTFDVLYSFCSAVNCTDGANPYGSVIMNGSGNLVGTTSAGGNAYNAGVAYELVNNGGAWSEFVLHTFCSKAGCVDGEFPAPDPVSDSAGKIFAVTAGGLDMDGSVFSLTPK